MFRLSSSSVKLSIRSLQIAQIAHNTKQHSNNYGGNHCNILQPCDNQYNLTMYNPVQHCNNLVFCMGIQHVHLVFVP